MESKLIGGLYGAGEVLDIDVLQEAIIYKLPFSIRLGRGGYACRK